MTRAESTRSYEQLLAPPPRRARGIKADHWGTGLVLGFGCVLVVLPMLGFALYIVIGPGGYDPALIRGFAIGGGVLILLLLGGAVFGLSPQWRSVWYARRRHRKVWDAIKRLADPDRGELHIEFIPELRVVDRRLFVASYRHKTDPKQLIPIATLLLDEEGNVLDDDALFEKAYVTYNFGLFASAKGQSLLDQWRRDNRTLMRKKVPEARQAIQRNQQRFETVGAGAHARRAIDGLVDFEAALREVERYLSARQGYVKAVGFGQHPVFYYEDADRFERMSVAFARRLEVEFASKLQELSLMGESLLHHFEQTGEGWNDRKGLEDGLRFVASSRLAIEKWIDDYGDETRVPEPTWKNYRNKTRAVRQQGVPVFSS